MLYSTTLTPAGPLTIVVDGDGAVLASGFTADLSTLALFVDVASLRQRDDVGDASKAALSYLDGDLTAIDGVVVRQRGGGEFLTHAWDVLRAVPAGDPVTYREFAALAGRPPAIRAAAQACARNAAALFVPCHRVLRTDGTLGGFRWGLPVKRWLLDHEKTVA
jgi:methylated-DNA-[protein]-cysteine S-methyltransferase